MGNKQSVKSHMENAQRTGVFQLTDAKLVEIPVALFRLKTLRSINLSNNRLKELPSELSSLTNLRSLLLNSNQLSALPAAIGQLTKLETLSLKANLLTTIPAEIAALKQLRKLDLSRNRLQAFPVAALADLRQLDFLDLSQNEIREIPPGVDAIFASEINLNENQLAKIDDDLAGCPRLKVLRVEENCLPLIELTRKLIPDSRISTLAADGNLFDMKLLHSDPGYDRYMERYTASRKKL